MNRLLTQGLFFETTLDKTTVCYTLKDWDHEGYPSLFRLYMDTEDPTEYLFATQYLDGFRHWEELSSAAWFQPYVTRWRRELELKMKSEALRRVTELAKTPGKDILAANKILLSYGHPGSSKGRPSKEDIRKAAEEQVSVSKQINSDFSRLLENTVRNDVPN